MASYRGHLKFSSMLAVANGLAATFYFNLDWGTSLMAAGLTAVSGLLPDLDSDSGVPVREMFNLAAVLVPLMLLKRMLGFGMTEDQTFAVLGILYVFIRFGLSNIFKHLSVHRGMFHSVPAMIIAGCLVFLCYTHDSMLLRMYMAASAMVGFLSHLVLDELCSVDFNGMSVQLNQFAGSAVKFFGPSIMANLFAWSLCITMGYLAWVDFEHHSLALKNGKKPDHDSMHIMPPKAQPLTKTVKPVAQPFSQL